MFTAPAALSALVLALASCGGGGGGSGAPEDNVVQGTAAVGSAVADGAIVLRCAGGERTGTTDATGRYRIDLGGLTLPCAMVLSGGRVDGTDSPWTLTTPVSGPGVANLTPWTHLVMAKLVGGDPAASAATLGAGDLQRQLTAAKVGDATTVVADEVAKLLGAAPQGGVNPITTAFNVTPTDGMDPLLQRIMEGLAWNNLTLPQAAQQIAAGGLTPVQVSPNCRPGVLSGFTGRFDDVRVQVPENSGGGGSDGGVGGGAGAGAGGSLGQFLSAEVLVTRADGSVLGRTVTDAVKGMVTVVPCGYRGPVRVQIKAKADGSSRYFEESTGTHAPFPKDMEMNAVVPSVTKNLGVTPLTEAAWQYLLAKHGPEGWKDPSKVNEANTVVKVEFNKFLPQGLQVQDITRLPFLVGEATPANSISVSDPNGVYGIVSSGLARVGGLMRAGDLSPALKLMQQFGRDLCDGAIDLKCHGVPVVENSADAAYLPPQFGETLNRGVGDVAASCGASDAGGAAFRVTQVLMDLDLNVLPGGQPFWSHAYNKYQPIYLLRSDGKAFYWRTRDSQVQELGDVVPEMKGLTFSKIFPQMGYDFAGVTNDGAFWARTTYAGNVRGAVRPEYFGATTTGGYAVTEDAEALIARMPDGRAKYFPDNALPQVDRTSITTPSLTPFGNIVSVSVGYGLPDSLRERYFGSTEIGPSTYIEYPTFYAVTGDGKLYAWGNDRFGALGDGKAVNSGALALPTPGPQQVLALKDVAVTQVVGRHGGAFAIDKDGQVYQWGRVTAQSLLPGQTAVAGEPDSGSAEGVSTPVRVTGFAEPIQQISCNVTQNCVALSRTGRLYAWGWFGEERPGFPTELIVPYKRTPLTKVPLPAGRRVTYIGSSQSMLYAVLDDSRLVVFPTYAEAPEFLDVRGKLPAATGGSSAVCGQ